MPQLNDILDSRTKKFTKRSYRPWDLSGTIEADKNSIANNPSDSNTIKEIHLDPNKTQTEHLTTHKPDANRTQIIDKIKQIEHKSNTKPNTLKSTNRTQTAHKIDTGVSFSALTGIQRNIIILLFNNCKISKQDITNEISISYVANSLNICNGSIKNSLVRLEEKRFITRLEYKAGRGGWSRYKLSDSIYSELLFLERTHKLDTNETQIKHKTFTEPYTQLYTSRPSSSSLHKLTTKQEGTEQTEATSNTTLSNTLPPEWASIDYSFLEDIGFNHNKLLQIYGAGHLTAEMVQESLYGFDFDRKHNDVKVNSPINFLMAQLKVKGLPYDLPKNYESPKVRAMREYLERMEANEQKEEALKQQLKTREFEKWFNSLSLEEQNTLVPPHGLYAKGSPRRAAFFKHFDENHWAEKEKVLFAGIFA